MLILACVQAALQIRMEKVIIIFSYSLICQLNNFPMEKSRTGGYILSEKESFVVSTSSPCS